MNIFKKKKEIKLWIFPFCQNDGSEKKYLYRHFRLDWKFRRKSPQGEALSGAQTGRSMLEVLGILAIIGVLSVGATMGYQMAMNKLRSNEIMNELTKRALLISALFDSGQTFAADEVIPMEMGDMLSMGNAVEAHQHANAAYFRIDVSDVPKAVCEEIVDNYLLPIIVVDRERKISGDECPESADMAFFFNRELSEANQGCVSRATFNVDSLTCQCLSNTYFDSATNACVCPPHSVWSDEEEKCFETICENENEFETLENGCQPCDTDTKYQIDTSVRAIALCNACEEREFTYVGNKCFKKKCEMGVSFAEAHGDCILCESTAGSVWIDPRVPYCVETCNACPNRYRSGAYCFIEGLCPDAGTFVDIRGKCQPCNTVSDVTITTDGEPYESCLACTNDKGEKNRAVKGSLCVKVVCDSGEFMGADGKCHSCTVLEGVSVDADSGCTDTTCGRTEVDGICKITQCPPAGSTGKYIETSTGACVSCDSEDNLNITEDECTECGRFYSASAWGLPCRPKGCTWGETYPGRYENCVSCDVSDSAGSSAVVKEYCEEGCGNFMIDHTCIYAQACNWGTEFVQRATNGRGAVCPSCSNALPSEIGTDSDAIEKCIACSAPDKRFYANGICYRWSDLETPTVTTDIEIQSCINADRIVEEDESGVNRCVLDQDSAT